jgi:hypothetical protein
METVNVTANNVNDTTPVRESSPPNPLSTSKHSSVATPVQSSTPTLRLTRLQYEERTSAISSSKKKLRPSNSPQQNTSDDTPSPPCSSRQDTQPSSLSTTSSEKDKPTIKAPQTTRKRRHEIVLQSPTINSTAIEGHVKKVTKVSLSEPPSVRPGAETNSVAAAAAAAKVNSKSSATAHAASTSHVATKRKAAAKSKESARAADVPHEADGRIADDQRQESPVAKRLRGAGTNTQGITRFLNRFLDISSCLHSMCSSYNTEPTKSSTDEENYFLKVFKLRSANHKDSDLRLRLLEIMRGITVSDIDDSSKTLKLPVPSHVRQKYACYSNSSFSAHSPLHS